MVRLLVFSFLLISCAHTRSYNGYPAPETKKDCMQLFRDIQEIQSLRHSLMNEMNQATRSFEQGRLSITQFQLKRKAWLENERQHRSNVTFLYDIGYEYGCF